MKNKSIAEEGFSALHEAHRNGVVTFKKAALFDDLFLHFDVPQRGTFRFTYAMFDKDNNVIAQAVFVKNDDTPSVECGWCVASESRQKGLGSKIVERSIQEFINGFSKSGVPLIVLGASVDEGNEASIKLAQKYIGDEEISKEPSGDTVRTYQRIFDFSK